MSMWPQITYIILSAMGLVVTLQRDKTILDRSCTFVGLGISHGLLYAGGFYDVLFR